MLSCFHAAKSQVQPAMYSTQQVRLLRSVDAGVEGFVLKTLNLVERKIIEPASLPRLVSFATFRRSKLRGMSSFVAQNLGQQRHHILPTFPLSNAQRTVLSWWFAAPGILEMPSQSTPPTSGALVVRICQG